MNVRPEAGLTDATGTQHRRAGNGARIVSLVPSLTELLFDLGLGECVVGRTGFCVHPAPAVNHVARVGGTKKADMEKVRRAEPTHVVLNIDENTREMAEQLARFVPNLVVTHPLAPEDNLALYTLLGGIFGREEAARALAAAFEDALAALERAAAACAPRRVLYLIWRRPWMTVSADTYIARTLALARWETVAPESTARYPEVALDAAWRERVDGVLLSSEPFPFRPRHAAEVRGALGDPAFPVEMIDGEMTSWYGSRAIKGLRYLTAMVGAHPAGSKPNILP